MTDVVETLKKIDYFNFGEWEKMGSGNAAELSAAEDFRILLSSEFKKADSLDIEV